MKLRLALLLFALLPALAQAAEGWSGAVGVGPISFPRYTGGKASQVWAIPILSVAYDDIAYIEPLRAGAYLWGSEDRKMGLGLAIEPRMGFKASDDPRLKGMATRRNSLEGGPAFDWDLDIVSISASLFTDLTQSSKGHSARLYVYRDLAQNEPWKVGLFGGVDHLDRRVANYFFGVGDSEANANRPAFKARASTNPTIGLEGHYRHSSGYAVLFGVQASRLGSPLVDSPIVQTRQSALAWLGLGFTL